MKPTLQRRALASGCVVVTSLALAASAAETPPIERFVATAISIAHPGPTGAGMVEIGIERWSTDAEHQRLVTAMIESGPDKLLDTLQQMPRAGYIRTPDSIGYDLRYARKVPLEDGGERIVIMTDRYISFWEAVNRPRTIDYPFTLIEMRIGPNGRGEGKMSLLTKIYYEKDKNQIVLENYASQPVMLTEVRREPANAP
jgi:hypothetical protein